MKKTLWMLVSGLMVLSLVLAACAPAAPREEEKKITVTEEAAKKEGGETQAAEKQVGISKEVAQEVVKTGEVPKYGGFLVRAGGIGVGNFDPLGSIAGGGTNLEDLWMGDWAKGPAGGYGTYETDWAHSYDIFDHKQGFLAEEVKWIVDEAKNQGTIIYKIRQGVHYYLRPNSEASRLVNGREMTADDIVKVLKMRATDPRSYVYRANPELRVAEITKTGPWEVTVKLPLDALVSGITRFTDATLIYPPEILERYGIAANDWTVAIGTGPFIPVERVPGSVLRQVRNPNYYMTDPVGPGKGNQIPYLDGLQTVEIPDRSTTEAALRTGKIDILTGFTREYALQMMKTQPLLKYIERTSVDGRGTPALMRTDKPPFNDVRVRRALVMSIDYEAIIKNYYLGYGQYRTYPNAETVGYRGLHLDFDELPEPAKEMFTYNPEKAKQLLREAGYPNGFKTEILIASGAVDYYSMVKDMWAKIGVDLLLDIRDSGAVSAIVNKREHNAIATATTAPIASFYLGIGLQGATQYNLSMLDDPVINEALKEVRLAVVKQNVFEAMKIYKEKIAKHVLEQAYGIPNAIGYNYIFWWPWLKGYSGEQVVGYDDSIWPQYIWYDTALKRKMGY